METLLEALGDEQPRALLLTHIHLDHAAATGALVRRWPELEVYVHERGAPHLIDPSKLLASAERLYGDQMERLWGEIVPVPEENVRPPGGRRDVLGMRVAYTPGHASHHVCYLHEESGTAFVGDVAACRIPPSDLIVPPTPPPDIDIEAWDESIETVEGLAPERLALTHFGAIEDPASTWRWSASAPARGGRAGPRAAPRPSTSADLQRRDRGAPRSADGQARTPIAELLQARPHAYQWRRPGLATGASKRRARGCRSAAQVLAHPLDRLGDAVVGVVSEMRKKPSPLGPYIEPGETTTAASSSTSSANEVEVWPSGTGAQT